MYCIVSDICGVLTYCRDKKLSHKILTYLLNWSCVHEIQNHGNLALSWHISRNFTPVKVIQYSSSSVSRSIIIPADSWRGGAAHRVSTVDSDGWTEAEDPRDSHGSHQQTQ